MALVLVIDDALTMRELVRRMLDRTNHSVIEAEDGEAGLTLFSRHSPDLVITDLIMPNKEGIETIREIRRRKGDTKIIAMSGSATRRENRYLSAARKLGADEVLPKPFGRGELLALIDQLLDRGH
jgi:DNA-binding response OmpR family regulator